MKVTFDEFITNQDRYKDYQIKKLTIYTTDIIIGPQMSRDAFRDFIRYIVDKFGLENIVNTNTISYNEKGYVRAGKKDDELTKKFHLDENTVPLMKKFASCIGELEKKGIVSQGTSAGFVFEFDADVDNTMDVDINVAISPLDIKSDGEYIRVTCRNCKNEFEKAPRCPECGQKILYV